METQLINYVILGMIIALCSAVFYLSAKIRKQNKIINKPQEYYGDSLQLIESAQKQANAIVEKAVESAKHILFETEYVKQDITREMQDSLSRVAEESVKLVQGRSTESEREFRQVVDEIKAEFAKEAEKKLSAIEKVTQDEINDFKAMLIKQTLESQEFIGNKIGTDFQNVQNELTEYKKKKMEEIDKSINSITKDVVKDLLGASITLPIHEDLIIASLENAKKGGLFKSLEESLSANSKGNPPTARQVNEDRPTPLLKDEGPDPEEPMRE
jgi:hypothetical protein